MLRHVLSAMLMVCVFGSMAAAKEYEIKFHRKAKVGDAYEAKGELKEEMKMTMELAGQTFPGQSQSSHFRYEFLEQIRKVDQFGNPSEVALVIRKLEDISSGNEVELVNSGTAVIAIVKDNVTSFKVTEGDALISAAHEALKKIVNLRSDEPKEDKIMGPDGKKSPGDSWSIDKKAMLESLPQDNQVKLDPEKIEGKVTFVEMAEHGDVPCLKIKLDVDMSKAIKSIQGLPPQARIKSAEMVMNGNGMLPEDLSIRNLQENMTLKMNIAMVGVMQGQPVNMKISQTRTQNTDRTKVE